MNMNTTRMARAGWKEIIVLLLCVSIPCCFSYISRLAARGQIVTIDFGELYYGARCAMHGCDPYNPAAMVRELLSDGERLAPDASGKRESVNQTVVTRTVNLPTGLFFAIPFAMLPWSVAQNFWMTVTALLLVAAAFSTWDLGAGAMPLLWLALAGFMLAESDLLFKGGNVAGIAGSLCVLAVWCFLKRRWIWIGVALLAISLVLKPHDSGFVWLYFLLSGGTLRRRALQTLAFTGILALCSAIWITTVSPRWTQELHSNLMFASVRGGTSDPGPAGMSANTAAAIIDLQGVLSGLKDNPHFYNPLAWIFAGLPILALALAALRKPATAQGTRLALAAISALSLLPVYHRINDAVILLLALPACAMLWKERAPERWLALGLTSAGILFTASTPLALLATNFQAIAAFASKLPGRLPGAILLRPTPVVLLAMGCFYLWLYLRHDPARTEQPSAAAAVATTAG